MRDSADAGRSADTTVAPTAGHIEQVGMYLTNGVFLYRIANVMPTESGEMADIEDCYRLDIVRVSMGDLLARRLRVVTPA